MKRFITFFTIVLITITFAKAQTAVVPCGGELTGVGGSASFTVGQIDYLYKDKDAANVLQPYSVWEGVQQVYPYLDKVYDTICPGDSYAQHGFNIGPFYTPGTVMDTIFIASVVNAMNDPNIHTVGPDTIRVLYLTVRTTHTAVPDGYYIELMAGNAISNVYSHILGNGADSATMVVAPANSEITNIFIGSSFMYGTNPLTQTGTYLVTYTTVGNGCPISFTDTIHIIDSLLCSITDITNDNSCGSGFGSATVTATGGSGNYSYAWSPTSPTQILPTATNLVAGTYTVTVTDVVLGITVSATAVVAANPFTASMTLADEQLCPGQSTTLQVSLTTSDTDNVYIDYEYYKLGQNFPFDYDYGSSSLSSSISVSPVGNEGDVIGYVVVATDWNYCEARDTVMLVLACEGAPSASYTVSPDPNNGPIQYDDNLQIIVYNPVPGVNVDTTCPLQYSINGGNWVTWTNPSVPVLINGNDIFVGQVTFDLRHSDTCSTGKIQNYTWQIAPSAGSISYTRDIQDMTVCISYDSVRMTNITVSGYDSTVNKFQWSYEYALHNNIQQQSPWADISTLGNPVVPYNTPYVPVNAIVGGYPTQAGDTIRIYVNLVQTNDGGATWTVVKSEFAEWIIRANPVFDLATMIDDTVCANQVQLFNVGSSEQGTSGWNYGIGNNYSNVQPVTGAIPYFNYSITSINGSTLSLSDFQNIDSLMAIFYLTPNNTSCPTIYDTALLQIKQLDTLILVSDSATLNQEFCIGGSLTNITYKWSGGASTATVIWNPSLPSGVSAVVAGDSLVISGTPTVSGTFRYSVMTDGQCSPGTGNGIFTINDLPTFSLQATNAGCKGEPDGSVAIDLGSLLGIESDYNYSWTDTNGSVVGNLSMLNNVGAGTYTVEVTTIATGCQATASAVVTEPATVVSTTKSQYDVTCHGDNSGMISITANGGNAPYDIYVYDTSDLSTVVKGFHAVPANTVKTSTGLPASTYIIYVHDANQCVHIDTVTITQPTKLIATISAQQNVTCYESEDGKLTVSASAGTPGYTYLWSNGKTTDTISSLAPGQYSVTVTDTNSCVATATAVITRPSKITEDFYDSACYKYIWNGVTYTQSGVYSQHLQTAAGCDSVATLHLTIYQPTYSSVNVTECVSYTWPLTGLTYNQSGDYYDTLQNANNCDSIVTLHLTINNVAVNDIYHVAVMTYTWPQNGQTYTLSGTYSDTLANQAANGCDSIINLHLTITANTMTITASAADANCYGDNSGSVNVTVSGGVAPYSIYVYESSDLSMAVKAFAGVQPGVQKIATGLPAGTYVVYAYDSLNSVITSSPLLIDQPAPITYAFADTACSSYSWEGSVYTHSQQIVKVLKTAIGCDSTVTLDLVIKPGYTTTLYDTICQGDVYKQNGFNDSIAGLHTLHLTSSDNCDSTVNLYLHVNPIFSVDLYDDVCKSTPYNNYGFSISSLKNKTPGDYEYIKTYTAVTGCDSIVKLHLKVNDTEKITVYDNVCHGEVYIGMGFAIRTEDSIPKTYTYTQNLQTSKGCDSIVTLILTIEPDYNVDIYDTICSGDQYNSNGFVNLSAAGVYTQSLQTVGTGCDSTINLHLAVIYPKTADVYVTDCQTSYTWPLSGQTYSASGDYPYTLTGGASNGCDSIVTLHLTLPAQLLSVTATGTNPTCNGGFGSVTVTGQGGTAPYTIYVYDTTDLGTAVKAFSGVGENVSKVAAGLAAGTYLAEVTDVYGCVMTSTSVTLTEPAAITSSFSVTDCNSYTWGTTTYTQSGVYTQKYTSTNGCDSTVTLTLTINKTQYGDVYVTDCQTSYTWPLSGQTYSASGDYPYTLTGGASNGCDSIVTLHLTLPAQLLSVTATGTNPACNGGFGSVTVTGQGGAAPYTIYIYETSDLTSAVKAFSGVGENVSKVATGLPAGTYLVEVSDAYGCVVTSTSVKLTEPAAITSSFSVTDCNSYTWGTATYTQSGVYTQKYTSTNGCDSTVTLTLTINKTQYGDVYVTDCQTSYTWPLSGQTYSASGDYTYTLTGGASNGCDSIVTLHLTLPVQLLSVTVTGTNPACNGDFGSVTVTGQGGAAPYTIYVYETSDLTSAVKAFSSVGENVSKVATGLAAGTYVAEVSDAYGCVVTSTSVKLTEPAAITTSINRTDCDSYTWAGTTYTKSGVYTKQFVAVNGCDSTVTLTLTINYTQYGDVYVTDCQTSYTWPLSGQTYSASGDYPYTLTGGASNGCDSIVTLHLTIPQVLLNATTSVTNVLCNGESTGSVNITVNGGTAPYSVAVYNTNDLSVAVRQFTNVPANTVKPATNLMAGSYMVSVTDANGCTFATTATITEKSAIALSMTSQMPTCNGGNDATASVSVSGGTSPYSYSWSNGQSSAAISGVQAGYYMVTVTDDNGCTASTSTTIAQPAKITHTFSHTECEKYVWNGITYTTSGSYTQLLQSVKGCDSLVTMNLTITKATYATFKVEACVAYTWQGKDLITSGHYYDTIVNAAGCDSIMHLDLTINHPSESHTTLTNCGPYYWNNELRTQSGNYFFDTKNSYGCDSTAWLHLTIVYPSDSDLYVTECSSYTWAQTGKTYTVSGTYVDTLYSGNSVGCDSVVTLHLTINMPSVGNDTIEECISYVWPFNGKTYTVSGDYIDTLYNGNSVGCDSIGTLHLTINMPTDSNIYETACVEYRWELTSETYTETGDYEYLVPGGNSVGCDSTVILHLTINQPSVEVFTVITNQPYHWDVTDNTYEVSGEYSHTYYGGAANGCDSTIILKLISSVSIDDNADYTEELNAVVYPNPTNDIINIVFDEKLNVKEARCYDMYGKLVKVQVIESTESQMDMSTFANGVYLLRLNNGKEVVKTFKVVKH